MPVVKQMKRRRNFLNKKNKLRSFKRIKCNVTNIISNTSKWCLLHYEVCRLLRLSPYDVCWYMMVVILWRLSVTTFVASWCLSPIRTFVTYRVCHSIFKSTIDCCPIWRLRVIPFWRFQLDSWLQLQDENEIRVAERTVYFQLRLHLYVGSRSSHILPLITVL